MAGYGTNIENLRILSFFWLLSTSTCKIQYMQNFNCNELDLYNPIEIASKWKNSSHFWYIEMQNVHNLWQVTLYPPTLHRLKLKTTPLAIWIYSLIKNSQHIWAQIGYQITKKKKKNGLRIKNKKLICNWQLVYDPHSVFPRPLS